MYKVGEIIIKGKDRYKVVSIVSEPSKLAPDFCWVWIERLPKIASMVGVQ